jgi:hypothetical protein
MSWPVRRQSSSKRTHRTPRPSRGQQHPQQPDRITNERHTRSIRIPGIPPALTSEARERKRFERSRLPQSRTLGG